MAQQEQQGGGGGGMGDLSALGDMAQMQELLNDPAMAKAMEEAMKELANMSPEEMQKQMQDALGMLTDTDMVDTILEKKEEVLEQLEQSGMVSKEDIAKYKSDPEAFEKEMRDAFGQMQKLFSDGDALQEALESMADPALKHISDIMQNDLSDDTKIEEVRLELLSKPELTENNPVLKALFDQEEFKESLMDEKKWREAVKKGQKMVTEGAGVGEL